jgi:PEP-CTERM motif-containing protein
MRIASLVILCLALAAVPAFADYNNGPINGTTDAWTINFGYVVSDTFTSSSDPIKSVSFGVWEFPGDTMQTVDYTISSTENGTGVGQTANVTDKFISTNQYGYNIDVVSFNVGLTPGAGTFWLNLYNATVPSGDPVFWDENSGPSSASESAVGTIPSEAFTVIQGGGTTPEPSSIMLFGSGILGLAGILRRKLF